ncbi:MAG: ferredoxin family protein [Thermoleophilia bacterium]
MPWFAGVERREIEWGPTIDPQKCIGCGMCMNCGKKVFDWADGKAVVGRYYDCVTGCTSCANLCQGNAISFPPLADLRKFYRNHKIWPAVKDALIAEGKIPSPSSAKSEE